MMGKGAPEALKGWPGGQVTTVLTVSAEPLLTVANMPIRDYFAIRAFQTRLAKYNEWTLTELTEQAYADADAMMKARKK